MTQYKAIIFDVDGTLSQYSKSDMPEMPSPKVIDAVYRAKNVAHVGIATSRPLSKMKIILDTLQLNCPIILHNGAQIVDPVGYKPILVCPISTQSLHKLFRISEHFNVQTFFSDFERNIPMTSLAQLTSHPVADVFFDGVSTQIYELVAKELEEVPDIAIHRLSSRWEGKYELSITNRDATKQSAIVYIANFLQIKPENIIGVGDGHNDIPLLMACGLKIALGNAVAELKNISDFVVPSVEDDGAQVAIDKFILAHV